MTEATTRPSGTPGWIVATISGIAGLFFAYAMWAGVSYLVVMAQTASAAGGSLTPFAWIAMVMTIALPVVLFIVAVLLGRRAGWWRLALYLVVGLGVVAVFWLNAQAYTTTQVVFQ
ncbi:hypothetical protein [Microbacterium sp. ZXX196]|uniref:hypothetical protein n=1 Tax=Microbacterium sp. ZXX196 TaxID=2609291 RepID=UPI0012B9CA86|nr:hypothetical protein [Microbacterium sp. ZXX196]MTE22927.1 hypothetical protein [Microbacterium sp. ZXX196]